MNDFRLRSVLAKHAIYDEKDGSHFVEVTEGPSVKEGTSSYSLKVWRDGEGVIKTLTYSPTRSMARVQGPLDSVIVSNLMQREFKDG